MENLQKLLVSKGYNIEVDGIIGPETLKNLKLYLEKELKKRNWFMPITDIVWLRLDDKLTNTFDDIGIRINKGKIDMVFPCSTTAGHFYIYNPITDGGITGTGIVAEQQVPNSHVFMTSQNWKTLWLQAPYFMQVAPIKFYRDGNKDLVLDKATLYNGIKGFNWHKAGISSFIDNWSAGCMVTQPLYWFEVIKIFKPGDKATLTLIDTTI